MSAALPPLPTPEAAHWEANQWGHAELTASDAYTADQMQAYATEARADLDAAIERKDALLRQCLKHVASNISMPSDGTEAEDLYDAIQQELLQ